MVPQRSLAYSLTPIGLLILLTLSMPFIHRHAQLTHHDPSGKHTHSSVIHTIFSPDGVDQPSPSSDWDHAEDSEELSRSTIGSDLLLDPFSTVSVFGKSTSILVSVNPFPLHSIKGAPLTGDTGFNPPASTTGAPLSARAPPSSFLF